MGTTDEIIYEGRSLAVPSLEVVKTVPKMSAGTDIDWLLHIFFARRDFVRCKKIIDMELPRQLNPEYLYFIKGLIDREERNNIEALRNLQKALDMNSKNIETYKEIGKTLFMMGRYNQALNVFREAEQLSPRADHEIFHFIGELLHRSAATQSQLKIAQEQQLEAKAYFQRAVECGKKQESFQRLADIYRIEKEYAKAIEVLENCLQLAPENTDVLTEIGVLYLKVNETQKAFDRLHEVINMDKKSPKGLLAFGAILQSRNDVDAALSKYKEIAATEPEIPELWNNIGLCFFKKRKNIAAISSLRKSVWLSPLNYNALYNLSLIYITAQQYASAFHTLAAAINLRKDSAECYMLLGICLRKLEDMDNAFTAFERSSAIVTSMSASSLSNQRLAISATAAQDSARNPLIYLNFALFCYESGRLALAAEQYNRFLSCSQDLLLPTEYKFQATKLKSLLKISTTSILHSPDNDSHSQAMLGYDVDQQAISTAMATDKRAITTIPTTASTELIVDAITHNPENVVKSGANNAATGGIASLVTPTEFPVEVNAVVKP